MNWIDINTELPPTNVIVKVLLTNGIERFDFVNEPINIGMPFQHYIVSKWRFATRDELNDLLACKNESKNSFPDWRKVEDELPKDNGHVQKFLVCLNRRTSCFQNCDIRTGYFTDQFKSDGLNIGHHDRTKITHWAPIEKPDDYK